MTTIHAVVYTWNKRASITVKSWAEPPNDGDFGIHNIDDTIVSDISADLSAMGDAVLGDGATHSVVEDADNLNMTNEKNPLLLLFRYEGVGSPYWVARGFRALGGIGEDEAINVYAIVSEDAATAEAAKAAAAMLDKSRPDATAANLAAFDASLIKVISASVAYEDSDSIDDGFPGANAGLADYSSLADGGE